MNRSGASSVQIPLIQPEPLDPLPVTSGRYVAALQNKSGELRALLNASAETWERLTPIVQFVGPKERPVSATSVTNWVKKVGTAVGSHPVYLDVMRLDATSAVTITTGERPVLAHIFDAARKRGMRFVPVVRVGESTKPHIDLVSDAADQDGHGVALRYQFREVLPPDGMSHSRYVEAHLSRVRSEAETADLLVDLEYIDPDDDLNGGDVAGVLAELLAVGPWRSVVVLGTSMPSMLSCVPEGSIGSLARREWEVWSQLEHTGLPRMPAFGDYAVQYPRPPQAGGGASMRANIRYTAEEATLVARGRGPVSQEGNEQYRDLCRQLAARSEFTGRDYSWGDATIADCAAGSVAPGAQNVWRGAGTSHHLQFVTNQLRQRQAGS